MSLLIGPLLRYVDETSATVWVETAQPGTVEVSCSGGPTAASPTFTVHGHHYALVVLEGLQPGSSYPYTVRTDGTQVWPERDGDLPPSRIRTIHPDRRLRVVFGSCRTSTPNDPAHVRTHGVDMLRAYGQRMAGQAETEWPSLLLLLGDQVYADEPPAELVEFTEQHDDLGEEVDDFEEYATLYRLAWTEPVVRWLLSTTPTAMIFDDHEVRDDWNISAAWQAEWYARAWWRRQATAGLNSYWIYQHLGNLSPAELADDPQLAEVRKTDGDAGELMDEFAWEAGTDPDRYRWSYARDHGRVRIVVLDTRCARVLTPRQRAMLAPGEWAWLEQRATGDVEHLIIGSSLPVLLPPGLQRFEGWNEAVCDGAWGRWAVRPAEWLRQALDLGHWGAFRQSFGSLAATVTKVVNGARGSPPATVLFLSGDVHYSYLAEARVPGAQARVHQAVCSPIRNPLQRPIRMVNAFASSAVAGLIGRGLARTAGVRRPPWRWAIRQGPFFHNTLGTLDLVGRESVLRFQTAHPDGQPRTVAQARLTGSRSDPRSYPTRRWRIRPRPSTRLSSTSPGDR